MGCRKREQPAPEAAPTAESAATPAVAPPTAGPEATLPTGPGTSLAPSNAGDPGKEAVKTQSRFNRNTGWLTKLAQNNPQLRSQVLAEIQKAGLSAAEMQELRKQAQLYGIKL
jgi:hypothetical protein